MRRCALVILAFGSIVSVGCNGPRSDTRSLNRTELKQRAWDCLKAAVSYEHNAAVRVGAVEAFEESGLDEARPWVRIALLDQSPAVRFAGATAVGRLRDGSARETLESLAIDDEASVRVAALFALHRLGETSQSGRMPGYLLSHEDVSVRRNAAMLFGFFEERGAIKILARAMRDADLGVRHQALEAMACLGNPEAKQELAFMTNTGVGSEEVFAINALVATGDPVYRDTFLYKLETAAHLETKLAAAKGLGRHGSDAGYRLAIRALRMRRTPLNDPNDPPADQALRVKVLAAAALGEIGIEDALTTLDAMLDKEHDPRLQVAAACAMLQILTATRDSAFPFGAGKAQTRRK